MMISGAFSPNSRFKRLLRLITRRYRSFRSEVANRPPSNCTMGRNSGGITGTASKIMLSGECLPSQKGFTTFTRWPERRRRCEEGDTRPSRNSSISSSKFTLDNNFFTASAPIPPPK